MPDPFFLAVLSLLCFSDYASGRSLVPSLVLQVRNLFSENTELFSHSNTMNLGSQSVLT